MPTAVRWRAASALAEAPGGHLALAFTSPAAFDWTREPDGEDNPDGIDMTPAKPAVAPVLRRLLEGEALARQRIAEAETKASARIEAARRAADEAVRQARRETQLQATMACADTIAEAERSIDAARDALDAELAEAAAAAEANEARAVSHVVRWVTKPGT